MNWNIVLIVAIVVLAVVAAWLSRSVRDLARERDWESCPMTGWDITAVTPTGGSRPGETQWDRMLREVGDPADISTSGAEFAMPKAKD